MDIRELKSKIINNTLDDSILILKYSDNKFLCEHYVDNIAKNKHKNKLYIESINDVNNNSDFFDEDDNYLYILDIEKLTEYPDESYKNLIIICKDLPDNLKVDFIDISKLLNWQIEDYVKTRLSGLSEQECLWLCQASNYNIYRLNNECLKLEMFSPSQQKIIFRQQNDEDAFCDLNSLNIFNFTNAVIKKDYKTVNEILQNLKYIDIEGTGILTIFARSIKNIIDVQFNPKASYNELGLSSKQYAAVKYNVGKFTNSQLINMFEFLTSLDMKLKNGDLQFKQNNRENNNMMVDYITTHLLTIGG